MAERCGSSSVPASSIAKSGGVAVARRKAAAAGSATRGQPAWKRIQASAAGPASVQTGVSASASVSSAAAAAGASGAGASGSTGQGLDAAGAGEGLQQGAEAGLRGGDGIGEAGCEAHGGEAHERMVAMVKNSTRVAAARAASAAAAAAWAAARGWMTASSSARAQRRVLQGGVEAGGELRLLQVAAGGIGMADAAIRQAHAAAGDGDLAEVEGGAVAALAAAGHDQPDLRPAQPRMRRQGRGLGQAGADGGSLRPGQDAHPVAALGLVGGEAGILGGGRHGGMIKSRQSDVQSHKLPQNTRRQGCMVEAFMKTAGKAAETLARGQGIALWRQITGTMEKDIAGGSLAPGARLPTEAELSARFGVNRHTVRRAMEELESRGLVRIEQGRGSFVAEDVLDYPVGPRTRFSETIRRQNREPQGRMLRIEELPADAGIAETLKLRRGRPVVLAERLGLADGRPVVIGSHWFSAARFPGIAALLAEDPSITKALARAGGAGLPAAGDAHHRAHADAGGGGAARAVPHPAGAGDRGGERRPGGAAGGGELRLLCRRADADRGGELSMAGWVLQGGEVLRDGALRRGDAGARPGQVAAARAGRGARLRRQRACWCCPAWSISMAMRMSAGCSRGRASASTRRWRSATARRSCWRAASPPPSSA